MELHLIDFALRTAATSLGALLCFLFWFSRIERSTRIAFALLVLTTSARFWSTLPPMTALDDPAQSILKLVGTGAGFFVTWFLVSIFLDNKRFFRVWMASGAVTWMGLLLIPVAPEIVPFVRVYAVLHFVALVGLFIYSGRGDLQDARRRIRPMAAGILLVHALLMAFIATPMAPNQPAIPAFIQALSFFIASALFAVWSLKANIDNWPGETVPSSAPSPLQRSMEQTALISRIQTEMKAGVWQVEGLTVAALAQRVKAPEHQVRRAINQVLGHRNFASFINSARIEAAMAKLRASEASGLTILEIAYDVGFSSLGPFNRAFREVTGVSPSDFRRQAQGLPEA